MQKKSLLVPTFGTGRRDERAFKERGIMWTECAHTRAFPHESTNQKPVIGQRFSHAGPPRPTNRKREQNVLLHVHSHMKK